MASKKLSEEEKEFLGKIKKSDRHKRGGSFVLSERGNIYHGIPFEAGVCVHGEENAIGTMLTEEGEDARFKMILIVGSENEIIMPCGRCRVAIKRYGTKDVSILCADKSLRKIEKFSIDELYPHPCEDKWLFD